MRQRQKNPRAFTLVEMVVVVAVIGIAASAAGVYLSGMSRDAVKRESQVRIAQDLRTERATSIQSGLVTRVNIFATSSGTILTYNKITPSGDGSCAAAPIPSGSVAHEYPGVEVTVDSAATSVCFDANGQPVAGAMVATPVRLVIADVDDTSPLSEIALTQNGGIERADGVTALTDVGIHVHDAMEADPTNAPSPTQLCVVPGCPG